MAAHQLLYLSRADVESVALRHADDYQPARGIAFKEKGHGKVEMPPKPGIHTQPGAFIHAMPAYIPAMKSAGLKWVSGRFGGERGCDPVQLPLRLVELHLTSIVRPQIRIAGPT